MRAILAAEVERLLGPVARPLVIGAGKKPLVILVVGVNGSGKTTTIGKLAAKFVAQGLKRHAGGPGDTRSAPPRSSNCALWAEKEFGANIVAREQGADAAGLAFDAINAARADGSDVVLMDTAGRLQNRTELMGELEKVIRVMKKVEPGRAARRAARARRHGRPERALARSRFFGSHRRRAGLVPIKLDGTARGGILVAIAEKFALPVHFIGVGETVEDLEPFAARDFAQAIAGLER